MRILWAVLMACMAVAMPYTWVTAEEVDAPETAAEYATSAAEPVMPEEGETEEPPVEEQMANDYAPSGKLSEKEQALISGNQGQSYSGGWSSMIDLDARVFIGTANLKEVKSFLDDLIYREGQIFLEYLLLTGSNGEAWVKNGEVKAGWGAQISGFVDVLPSLGAGLKLNYFQPGTIRHEGFGDGDFNETWDATMNTTLSMWSATAGFRWQMPREIGFWSYGLSLMAGPAMASAEIEVDQLITDPVLSLYMPIRYKESLAGNGVIVDLGLQAEYPFSEPLSGVMGLGYRFAVIPQMKVQRSIDIDNDGVNDINSGDVFKDMNGDDVRFDFSGFDFSIGLVYRF